MKKISAIVLFFALGIVVSGCFHRSAPGGKGGVYDSLTNRTTYTVEPWGSISFTGHWDGGRYNKTSHNQYFYRADTSTLVVSVADCKSLPFGKQGLEGYAVVKRFYELEQQYMSMQGATPEIVIEDEAARYMIWKSHVDGIDQYSLFGLKDCSCNECVYRSLTLKTRKMSAEQKVAFLKDAFLR